MKPGPYEPELDKEFADWAPVDGDPAADLFLKWLESAEPGEVWGSHGQLDKIVSASAVSICSVNRV